MKNPIEEIFNTNEETVETIDFDQFLEEEFGEQDIPPEEPIENKNLEDLDVEELIVKPNFDRQLTPIEEEMAIIIQDIDRKSWYRGEGLKTRFKIFTQKLDGIQPGLVFIGGESNMGKSGFLLDIGYTTPLVDKTYSLYFSIDDSVADLLPRVIASKQRIPINSIRLPLKYKDYPKILERRKKGIIEVYETIDRFKIIDQDYIRFMENEDKNENVKDIETVEKVIRRHYNYLKENNIDKKLFVQIDSFHDLESRNQKFYSDKEKYSYLSAKLKDLAEELDIPIWCTGELKKLGGQRRPIKEDLREANKIVYKATLILMVYNEVGVLKNNAEIYFRSPEKPGKMPIFEIDFVKNKQSEFKGRLYYEFLTDYALFEECLPEDMERFNNLIYSSS